MCDPVTIGVGVLGAGATIASGNAQRDAARSASNSADAATAATLQIARDARDATTNELRPYASAGTDALAIIRQMLGLGTQPSVLTQAVLAGQPPSGDTRTPGGANGGGFGITRGDIVGGKTGLLDRQDDPAAQDDDRPARPGAAVDPAATPGQGTPATGYEGSVFSTLVDDAMETFEESPWWQFAQQETNDAINDLDSRYGATGLMLSGQAARARAEIAARLRGDAFAQHYNQRTGAISDYLSSLFGLTDTGFRAASGIGSGGANYANTASTALTNNAAIRGNAAMAGADGIADAWANGAGFGGWALGQWNARPTTARPPTTTVPTIPNDPGG